MKKIKGIDKDILKTYFVLIIILIAFFAILLTTSYFSSEHAIVNIIDKYNWRFVLVGNIISLILWTIAILGGIFTILKDDIDQPKDSIRLKIIIPLRDLGMIIIAGFVFYLFIINAAFLSARDIWNGEVKTYDGCYQLSFYDPAKGPTQYYLQKFQETRKQDTNKLQSSDIQIIISEEDYNNLINGQDCKEEVSIEYLPNSKMSLEWVLI